MKRPHGLRGESSLQQIFAIIHYIMYLSINDGWWGRIRGMNDTLILSSYGSLIPLILGIVIFVLVFLLLREFWCWYFKINEIRDLLKKIEENTRQRPPVS